MATLKDEIELLEREIKKIHDRRFIDEVLIKGLKEELSKLLSRKKKNAEMKLSMAESMVNMRGAMEAVNNHGMS